MSKNLDILYIDNHVVIVSKPAGLLVQGDDTGDETLLEWTKAFIKEKYNKPGNVYLGLVHRLDRPTSGVICFAKTSKAAARLSKQFQKKTIEKKYLALVQGKTPKNGTWIDKIDRKERTSFISENGKIAELSFEQIAYLDNTSLVEVNLKTGRHHQIRVQFAHRGFPLLGDFRYGSKIKFPNKTIGLHSYSLKISHPTLGHEMTFLSHPQNNWPEYFRNKAKEMIDEKNLIQIAGIKSKSEAQMLLSEKVDLLGFPLRLPVNIDDTSEEEARTIILETNSREKSVLISYLSDADEIAEFSKFLGINIVQLHGDIKLRELEKLKHKYPHLQIIKSLVVGLMSEEDIEKLIHYSFPFVDYYITDTYNPKTGASGATGLIHDWNISHDIVEISPKPVILAGGLNPDNVAAAIEFVKPAGVDAHTGVENKNGDKDLLLVRNFVRNAQAAFAGLSEENFYYQENSDTLDLHNYQPKDVKNLVHDFVEVTLEKGFTEIRIIHGKGIGVLRDIVHGELEKNDHVQSYKLANDRFSSWGATIVNLRSDKN